MYLRSHSHVKVSMVLTRAGNLFIHNYIRSLLTIILIPILMVRSRLEPALYTVRKKSFLYHRKRVFQVSLYYNSFRALSK